MAFVSHERIYKRQIVLNSNPIDERKSTDKKVRAIPFCVVFLGYFTSTMYLTTNINK